MMCFAVCSSDEYGFMISDELGDCGMFSLLFRWCCKLGNYCLFVLSKLIGADRRQILLDLLGTQSCIVRDGFGAGLGQSDRDRKREK